MTVFQRFQVITLVTLFLTEPGMADKQKVPKGEGSSEKVEAAVLELSTFIKSFEGMPLAEAKKWLRGGKITQSVWEDHGIDGVIGHEVVAAFPKHEVILFTINEKVIVASLSILSSE